MIIEQQQEILPFWVWFVPAMLQWLVAVGVLLGATILVGTVVAALRHGIFGAMASMVAGVIRGLEDLVCLSPYRTWDVARLVVKESIRKRVVIICVVFLVLLMFAGWFLNPNAQDPARTYTSFVLSTTTYLILLLALFLSAFSIPNDIKSKTIYTIVTKPVRASELVLGRIFGITAICTTILIFMAMVSYLFVSVSLNHTHLLLQKEDLTTVERAGGGGSFQNPSAASQQVVFKGQTQLANNHRHEVEVLADDTVIVRPENGHTHQVTFADGRFDVADSQGLLQARVPQFGKLTFRGTGDIDESAGINVGDEWFYRSFIGGVNKKAGEKNKAAAFWTFNHVTPDRFAPERFPDGVPVEMTLGVFRTHKGDMEKPVYAKLSVRNPKTGLTIETLVFGTQEFVTKGVFVPFVFTEEGTSAEIVQRKTRDTNLGKIIITPSDVDADEYRRTLLNKETYSLFSDIVADGNVEVWLQCLDDQQYIGVGAADLYLRAADASVPLNFVKGFFGIWLQALLLLSFGVLMSTFLSGPVAMLGTIGIMVAGFCKGFLLNIGLGSLKIGEPILGGGPFESFWRIIAGTDMMTDLPASVATTLVKTLDTIVGAFLSLFGQAIPPLANFQIYNTAVSSGFDISPAWMLQHSVETCAYLFPIFLVGYLILSNREMGK